MPDPATLAPYWPWILTGASLLLNFLLWIEPQLVSHSEAARECVQFADDVGVFILPAIEFADTFNVPGAEKMRIAIHKLEDSSSKAGIIANPSSITKMFLAFLVQKSFDSKSATSNPSPKSEGVPLRRSSDRM